jgi:16S rRNA (cytidine1402-2'-O)-methyltransferase
MVFFEAPHRVLEVVEALSSTFGDTRRAAVCRELTKTFEEIMRGTLGDLHTKLRQRSAEPGGIRGEFAVVVEGTTAIAGQVTPALFDAVIREVAQGSKLKEAVAAVAESAGVSKRELYNAYLTR